MAKPSLVTDYHQCACGTRIIWPVDAKGTKLPPANYGPDPAGQMAIQHTAAGAWLARFLARDDPEPAMPEKRFSLHRCQAAQPAAIIPGADLL